MSVNIINGFIEGFKSVLLSLGATLIFKSTDREHFPQDDWLITSTLNGQVEGKILIGMSDYTLKFMSQIFHFPYTSDVKMKNSFLREIGNMVMGHTVSKYQQLGVYADFIEINCYDDSRSSPDYLKRAPCTAVELNVNGMYPLMIYFILGDDYKNYLILKKLAMLKKV